MRPTLPAERLVDDLALLLMRTLKLTPHQMETHNSTTRDAMNFLRNRYNQGYNMTMTWWTYFAESD